MRAFVLAFAALLASSSPVTASVQTIGGSYAGSCYAAAESRRATPDALEDCDQALAVQVLSERDRVATHVNRGILEMIRGDGAGASADFERALALDPREAEAWLNKGVLVLNGGDSRSAAEFAQRAMDLGTQHPGLALYIRAVANEDSGNASAAYRDLVQAAQLEPRWSLPREELKRYRVIRH